MKKVIRTMVALPLLVVFSAGVCLMTYAAVSALSRSEESITGGRKGDRSGEAEIRPSPAVGILSRLGLNPFRGRSYDAFGVIIENHESAREFQSGLHEALMVQEWMVEGFISRFIVILNRDRLPDRIGPVRSLRPYFVDGTAPWIDHIVHAGGSPEAFEEARKLKTESLNALLGSYNGYFERLEEAAAPHDLFIEKDRLLAMLEDETLPQTNWPPFATGRATDGTKTDAVHVNFHSPVHNVTFTYDPQRRSYVRDNGYQKEQAKPSTVLIVEMPVESIGELGRLSIPIPQNAPAVLLRNGMIWQGTWSLDSEKSVMIFRDEQGESVPFASGQLWMTVVPNLERVTWESAEASAVNQ